MAMRLAGPGRTRPRRPAGLAPRRRASPAGAVVAERMPAWLAGRQRRPLRGAVAAAPRRDGRAVDPTGPAAGFGPRTPTTPDVAAARPMAGARP
jgi:hypothetical protein